MKKLFWSLLALAQFPLAQPASAEMFSSAYAQGTCITNVSGTARIQGCVQGLISQSISMNWIRAENVFYGELRIGNQCLQGNGRGSALTFASCNGGKAQEWKLSGATGMLNNGQNMCADISGASRNEGTAVIAWDCTGAGNQKWWNESYRRVVRIASMRPVPVGTRLRLVGSTLYIDGSATVVATSVSGIIAAGGGNIIAAGGGNIIASGALN